MINFSWLYVITSCKRETTDNKDLERYADDNILQYQSLNPE